MTYLHESKRPLVSSQVWVACAIAFLSMILSAKSIGDVNEEQMWNPTGAKSSAKAHAPRNRVPPTASAPDVSPSNTSNPAVKSSHSTVNESQLWNAGNRSAEHHSEAERTEELTHATEFVGQTMDLTGKGVRAAAPILGDSGMARAAGKQMEHLGSTASVIGGVATVVQAQKNGGASTAVVAGGQLVLEHAAGEGMSSLATGIAAANGVVAAPLVAAGAAGMAAGFYFRDQTKLGQKLEDLKEDGMIAAADAMGRVADTQGAAINKVIKGSAFDLTPRPAYVPPSKTDLFADPAIAKTMAQWSKGPVDRHAGESDTQRTQGELASWGEKQAEKKRIEQARRAEIERQAAVLQAAADRDYAERKAAAEARDQYWRDYEKQRDADWAEEHVRNQARHEAFLARHPELDRSATSSLPDPFRNTRSLGVEGNSAPASDDPPADATARSSGNQDTRCTDKDSTRAKCLQHLDGLQKKIEDGMVGSGSKPAESGHDPFYTSPKKDSSAKTEATYEYHSDSKPRN